MDPWTRIAEFPTKEQNKVRWLLRHSAENGMVEQGIAMKFGREWLINREKLPAFLVELTLRKERGRAA